ncbi:MAG: sulfatase-like hydrolase/transferase [Dorea sp.]|nr:sulfatase-like hydrolase/transferase [Dorea sp.]
MGTILAVLLSGLAFVIYFGVQWMFDTWNNLTMDELVFHLTAPLEGTNEEMVWQFLDVCVAPAALVLILVVILFIVSRKRKRYYVIMGTGIIVPLIMSCRSVYGAWDQLDAGDYVKNQGTYSTFIDDYYVNPKDVEIVFPQQKRNLIYIFLESMETTFADQDNGGAFRKNVIPELTELAQEYEDFSGESTGLNGGYSMPGTTWTVGAMFAHTSGLPLNISISNNYMDTQDSFFSGIATLGDILDEEGYSQTLLIGSEAKFGGRELYFTEHGRFDIEDYVYALEEEMLPEDYRVWWGYEDQKLFRFAKDKLKELADQEEPFNLTILTADTHFEDGYLCERCPERYKDNYSNVMACSSSQVNEFIEWVKKQDFYEDTAIVLVGDHPTMDSDFCKDVDSGYIRKVYTSFINSAVEVQNDTNRNYTTFDMFPTALAAMGAEIEGDRLGLGTNLFSTVQTLTERVGIETEKKELEKKSKLMEEIADLDEDKEEILRRDGLIDPAAEIALGAYDNTTGIFSIEVKDIVRVPDEVATVLAAVWANEDQSDLQWIKLEDHGDGSYAVDINMAGFNYVPGIYKIHIYVIDSAGNQHVVGVTEEEVDI